jgi:hypothetical protein
MADYKAMKFWVLVAIILCQFWEISQLLDHEREILAAGRQLMDADDHLKAAGERLQRADDRLKAACSPLLNGDLRWERQGGLIYRDPAVEFNLHGKVGVRASDDRH